MALYLLHRPNFSTPAPNPIPSPAFYACLGLLLACSSLQAANPVNADFRLALQPIQLPVPDLASPPLGSAWYLQAGMLRQFTPPRDGNSGFFVQAYALQVGGSTTPAKGQSPAGDIGWWNRSRVAGYFDLALFGGDSDDRQVHLDGSAWATALDIATPLLESAAPGGPALAIAYGGGLSANLYTVYESPSHAYVFSLQGWAELGLQATCPLVERLNLNPYALCRVGFRHTEITRGIFGPISRVRRGFVLPFGGLALRWNWDAIEPVNAVVLDVTLGGADSPRWVSSAQIKFCHAL